MNVRDAKQEEAKKGGDLPKYQTQKSEVSYWSQIRSHDLGQTKGPINKGRGHYPKQSWQKRNLTEI